jgi:enamine deaminase RidA (YjgF/YER057c/UK114 family)
MATEWEMPVTRHDENQASRSTGRTLFGSGAPWEAAVGYSRAVRVGNVIHVAGTTALDEQGRLVGEGDAYAQARQVLQNIRTVLERADSGLADVVRTRIYVTDISLWEQIGRAHGEVLGHVRPVCTMVEVARLIDPRMLVEIEAEAMTG